MSLPVIASKRFKFEDVPNLVGRVALVLGGSAGIGYNSALALALANANVTIASSTEEHGEEALAKIREAVKESSTSGAGTVDFEQVDLGSLSETRALAEKIKQKGRLDIVIGDAGVGVAPFGLTKDGLGNHFQVHLDLTDFGHMLISIYRRSTIFPNSYSSMNCCHSWKRPQMKLRLTLFAS